MGYRKVYLDMQEEEDIAMVKAWREKEGLPGAAFNAILKEGLATVVSTTIALRNNRPQGEAGEVVSSANEVVSEANESSSRRRRRRRA